MNNRIVYGGILIAVVLAIIGIFTPVGQTVDQKVGQIVDTFTGDIFDAGTSFKLSGTTVLSSTGLTIGTSNTATTTTSVGCIQTTATSTATPIKLAFTASSVSTTTFGATANGGTVVWTFGSCP